MMVSAVRKYFSLAAGSVALMSCAAVKDLALNGGIEENKGLTEVRLNTIKLGYNDLPGWKGDRIRLAFPAFKKSCVKNKKHAKKVNSQIGSLEEMGRVLDWQKICNASDTVNINNEAAIRYFFESNFEPYLVRDLGRTKGRFTGYYEPELRASWKPGGRYRVPIYSRPKDLVTSKLSSFDKKLKDWTLFGRMDGNSFVPYYTRTEIDAGVLNGKQLEIVWVDSETDAFFLHVQGSGRAVFKDGSFIRLGFNGRNGRPYRSIGRELVTAGVMRKEVVSMQSIRAWIDQNPAAGQQLMRKNGSYIFFRVLKGDGPIGAAGTVLTPGRSLAVDPRYIPYGVPVWLNSTFPGKQNRPLQRLLISQDTGSAIKGVIRGDVFWGFGPKAGDLAGAMNEQGEYYVLLPRTKPLK